MNYCNKHFLNFKKKCYKCEKEIQNHIEKQYENISLEERKKIEIMWDYATLNYERK